MVKTSVYKANIDVNDVPLRIRDKVSFSDTNTHSLTPPHTISYAEPFLNYNIAKPKTPVQTWIMITAARLPTPTSYSSVQFRFLHLDDHWPTSQEVSHPHSSSNASSPTAMRECPEQWHQGPNRNLPAPLLSQASCSAQSHALLTKRLICSMLQVKVMNESGRSRRQALAH
jgi:hypothetical protein